MDVSTPMNSFDKKWLFSGTKKKKEDKSRLCAPKCIALRATKDFSIRPYETRPNPISQNSIGSHFMIPTSNHLNFFAPAPYKFTLHENNNGGALITTPADAHILKAKM